MTIARWKTLSSRPVYKNRWTAVREDIVELPDGRTSIYGVVTFGHCVGTLPLFDDGRVLLVHQYRYVQNEFTWEMPTGGIAGGETPEDAAQRELQEEAGHRARQLIWVSTYYTSKSVCNETAHIYIGRGLEPMGLTPDDTEFLEIGIFPFDEVLRMVLAGEIRDGMTVTGVLHAARLRDTGAPGYAF
jgi:ADP-ribose pyrophosphatase